ncbi:hypothetical protein Zm00014a_042013 [Zea mays]|uniref:Uncharacterized protein n=1 Tax=Zea mays TaxID=4577 RepID=A0A3L6DJ42_MAIZE|nr:hypothetical protein Zm00014a_042013 [Zea mays]
MGTAQQHASREDTESQAMAGLEERLLLQFLGAGKGKLQGVAPMGRGSLLKKILGVTAGSRGPSSGVVP